jgi:hypothetical protein
VLLEIFQKLEFNKNLLNIVEFSIHGSNRAGKNIERGLREFTLIFGL